MPLFFPLGDLLLEGGGQGVAEQDAAPVEGDRFAASEAEAGRCPGGGGLEFLGEGDGLFGQQALQGVSATVGSAGMAAVLRWAPLAY